MGHRKSAIGLFALALVMAGCASSYYEHWKDGRLYVVGSKESSESFKESGHLPYTRTFVGQGPKGSTVVIEASKDGDELADRLTEEFRKRYPRK